MKIDKVNDEFIVDCTNNCSSPINNPYKIEVKNSVSVGCMENTRKADWEKVYKLLK